MPREARIGTSMRIRQQTNARRWRVLLIHRPTTTRITHLEHRLLSWSLQLDLGLPATEAISLLRLRCRVVNRNRRWLRCTSSSTNTNSMRNNSSNNNNSSTEALRLRPHKVVLSQALSMVHRQVSNIRSLHTCNNHSRHNSSSLCSHRPCNTNLTPMPRLPPGLSRVLSTATIRHLHTSLSMRPALPTATATLTEQAVTGLLPRCPRSTTDTLSAMYRQHHQVMRRLLLIQRRRSTTRIHTNRCHSHTRHNHLSSHTSTLRLRHRVHAHPRLSPYNLHIGHQRLHPCPQQRHSSPFLLYRTLLSLHLPLFPHPQVPTATSPTLTLVKCPPRSLTSGLTARPSPPSTTTSLKRLVPAPTHYHSLMALCIPNSMWTMTMMTKVC
jgi:hypothetical protein